jgi:SRSO17 transposase
MDRAAAVASGVGDVDPAGWLDRLDDLFGRVLAPAFVRREPRLRAWSYLLGLTSGLERKNGWTLAEFAGDATPDGMQRLLNAAVWDEDEVRDRLTGYVAAELGDPGGVLIADETGFLKSGRCSAGVQRQYTGTAGKITNCQVGVFLAYAVPAHGVRVLVDRELYVPRSWTGDGARCAAAGIAGDTEFATKPQLARRMIERAMASGLPFGWFTADEAYGDNGELRDWLEDNSVAYVVAVACDHRVPGGAGTTIRADKLAARVPVRGWHRLSCGPGSKGERLYDWALSDAGRHGQYLLIRRSATSGELAYYRCWAPCGVTLAELARVAGARWAVEECFAAVKNETALDHYQVRRRGAWYRHVTLAMCAHAWLAVVAAASRPPPGPLPGARPGAGGRATQGAGGLWTTCVPAAGQSRLSGHRRPAAGLPDGERDPATARDLVPARSSARPSPALVGLAAPASGARPALPLPAAAAAAVNPALPGRRGGWPAGRRGATIPA